MERPRDARRVRDAARDISDIVQVGLRKYGTRKNSLPNDYQYDNARPGEELKAKTIFGLATELDANFQAKGSRAPTLIGLHRKLTLDLPLLLLTVFGKKFLD